MARSRKTSSTRSSVPVSESISVPMPESGAPGAALLAIDLQSTLLDIMSDAAGVRSRAGLALAAAHGLGIPVVFSEQVPAKLGPTLPALRKCAPDAKVFGKDTFSALSNEALAAHLHEAGVEHLLLCGLETPVCVYQTALSALGFGMQVTVLSDAVGARRDADAAACFAALRHAGVHVLPVETVFYALLHDAGHPFFKPFTQLVKNAGK
jgi:nicotinamidase-related amidase